MLGEPMDFYPIVYHNPEENPTGNFTIPGIGRKSLHKNGTQIMEKKPVAAGCKTG